ncbi:DNA/RNA helicase [Encephalitozoon cuniculi EcunIII-L]|uniref:Chromatin-remodeling ATPase INO80 n=1 Tax=Encephalitozoon cuniculi TaxID=6035 RepID=M1KAD2_ENCCN|nr:global transcriptional activator [Encephalitozoon cuniculi]KMV65371.1 DNA/RNA helicase [Encephalitozoon cuniculi EcunIII-L]
MTGVDLEDILKVYERRGEALNIEKAANGTRHISKCVMDVPVALLNYPEVRHLRFLAKEKISQIINEMRSQRGEGDTDSERTAEWISVMRNIRKVHSAIVGYESARIAYSKKISIICARELRRGLSKTSRTNPILKSKRIYRELYGHIKKTERNMKDRFKKAEKEEMERKKREMEEKEELRQKRKFEYLLSQTELFSHFILKKNRCGLSSAEEAERKEIGAGEYNGMKGYEAAMLQKERLREFGAERSTKKFKEGGEVGETTTRYVPQPSILKCTLKEYQLRGLNWLVSLYDKGINGILADDMGLGKTVQSISLLAHLYETEEVPGPFLVVTISSTLDNWAQEFARFLPSFRVCRFSGSPSERKELKKRFKNSDVVITTYQTAVSDEKMLKKIKWQYMILDEAQAIKSSMSRRWKTLLSFKARNRLLLTGTPIQNSMQELWALLHFIMPTLFDSLNEFSDWFSKEIETSAIMKKTVDEKSLQRLHAILKPFMLRRHKSDVIHELGQKTQIDLYCDLSYRQKVLYKEITRSCSSMEMENLLMQLKKVCNHPDLFKKLEPRCGLSLEVSDGIGDVVSFGRSKMDIKIPSLVAKDALEMFRKKEYEMIERINGLRRIVNGEGPNAWYLRGSLDFKYGGYVFRSVEEAGKAVLRNMGNPESSLLESMRRVIDEEAYRLQRHACCISPVVATAPRLISNEADLPEIDLENRHIPLNTTIYVPPLNTFISDSGKLVVLDELLPKLKAEGHRLLMYFQMTRMIDLIEDYLVRKGYTYLRLDGSLKASARAEVIRDWQASDKFIFLLSTRAGGLGINLTAADTVVFYDSDWNPTADQQAMDRAHRLGQTRDVTVYRLITRGTVEEKVLESANRKDEIQKMVIHGNIFEGENF